MCFIPSVLHEISSKTGLYCCFWVENTSVNIGFVTDRQLGTEHKCMGLGHCQTCRREVKRRFAWDDVCYPKLSMWPFVGITQGAVSSLILSSPLLWCCLQKTETLFQPWSKLLCCFTIRIGHHDNTLYPTWQWNMSSGKHLAWNCREITGIRAEHMMPTAGTKASVWSLCTAMAGSQLFWYNTQ